MLRSHPTEIFHSIEILWFFTALRYCSLLKYFLKMKFFYLIRYLRVLIYLHISFCPLNDNGFASMAKQNHWSLKSIRAGFYCTKDKKIDIFVLDCPVGTFQMEPGQKRCQGRCRTWRACSIIFVNQTLMFEKDIVSPFFIDCNAGHYQDEEGQNGCKSEYSETPQ